MTCSVCGSEFLEAERRKGSRKCRACRLEETRRWRATHAGRVVAYRQEYYLAHAEEIKAAQSEYRAANPETRSIAFKEWYSKNKEYRSGYMREYRNIPEKKERIRELDNARYARDQRLGARRLIQARVAKGTMPTAASQHCVDCGGMATDYDHYLGYTGADRYAVVPVCKPCHQVRTNSRAAA